MGSWLQMRFRAWLAPPPEPVLPDSLPPPSAAELAAPRPPVDWRRGIITLSCSLTCWLFGGLLLFAKGVSAGWGSWVTWLGVVCVILGVAVGCAQPAGRMALGALRSPMAVLAAALPLLLYPLIGYWAAVIVFGVGGAFLLWRAGQWAMRVARARRGEN